MIQITKLHTFTGHRDAVYTLCPGRTPQEFFSGAGDGMVVQWDLSKPDEGQLIANLPTSVYALVQVPGQDLLVVGQNYQGIHVVDLNTRKEVGSLKLTEAAIFDLKFVGDLLWVACGDGAIYQVHLPTLSLQHTMQYAQTSVRTLALDGQKKQVVAGYSDNHIRVMDMHTGALKHEWDAHKNSVFSLCKHPSSEVMLSGSRDAHLKVWDMQNSYDLQQSVVAHMYAINHIEFSPNGQHFVTCSMDKSIKVWSSDQFKLLKVIDKARYASHGTSVNKLYWSEFEQQLVSCSDDRTISIWDINFD